MALNAREKSEGGQGVGLPFGRLERLRRGLLAKGLEPKAVDVGDAGIAVSDLVLEVRDGVVETVERLVHEVFGVARKLEPVKRPSHVHARLLAGFFHVPFGHPHVRLGRLRRAVDLPNV